MRHEQFDENAFDNDKDAFLKLLIVYIDSWEWIQTTTTQQPQYSQWFLI